MASYNKYICRLGIVAALGLAIGAYMAMGCGSSGSSGSSSSGGSSGSAASADSLKTVPTADVSAVDPTATTTASSDESLPEPSTSKSVGAVSSKALGSTFREEGGSSRAFCEQQIHKDQVEQMALQVQMPRCFLEAMEEAGAFTVPKTGAVVVKISPPKVKADERNKMCANIPAERTQEIKACKSGDEGPAGKEIIARMSRDNGLQINICEDGTHDTELTYIQTAADAFSVAAIRKAKFMGHDEQMSFTGDITGIASITDAVPTLSSAGRYNVTAKMVGGPGSGVTNLIFEDDSYTLKSAFKGGFTDPFSGRATSFTGKSIAIVDVTTASANLSKAAGDKTIVGCAKFSFTGQEPPMKVANMIPFDLPADQRDNFQKQLGSQLGIQLDATTIDSTLLCSNPAFDPANPSDTIKPIIKMSGSICGEVTHTGVECFRMKVSSEKNDFGGSKFNRSGTVVARTQSARYDEVNAFDLNTLSPDTGTIAFARSFDCTGVTDTIDFTSVTPAVGMKMGTAIQKCMALDEKARDNGGMVDYSCNSQDNKKFGKELEKKAQDGTLTGMVDGEYARGFQQQSNCIPMGQSVSAAPERIFVNLINADQKKYCIPSPDSGSCTELTVDASIEAGLDITAPSPVPGNTVKITQIAYGAGTGVTTRATTAAVSFSITGLTTLTCTDNYTLSSFGFTPKAAGATVVIADACKSKGITDPKACGDFCSRPENKGCQ